jgi:hypothetical protein
MIENCVPFARSRNRCLPRASVTSLCKSSGPCSLAAVLLHLWFWGAHVRRVVVCRGTNFPVRYNGKRPVTLGVDEKTGAPLNPGTNNSNASATDLVRPFVEVRFQESMRAGAGGSGAGSGGGSSAQRTVSKRGSNPRWDEILVVPFQAPQEQAALEYVRENISFHVFDEVGRCCLVLVRCTAKLNELFVFQVVTDIEPDKPQYKSTYSSRVERRWLGCFQLPFRTLYLAGTVFGTFRLQLPLNPIGYVRPLPRIPTTLYVTPGCCKRSSARFDVWH